MIAAVLSLLLARAALAGDPLAGAAVRSEEWKVRREPVKEEEFIGKVSARSGGTLFNADWALFSHSNRLWKARGSIHVSRRLAAGDLIEARGERGEHSLATGKGFLDGGSGPVRIEHTDLQGLRHQGWARQARWDSGRVALLGEVRVEGPRLDAWAEQAELDRRRRVLRLTGSRPVLVPREAAWRGALKADEVTAENDGSGGRVRALGRAAGWLQFR